MSSEKWAESNLTGVLVRGKEDVCTQTDSPVRPREDGCVHAEERHRSRNQQCGHLHLGPPPAGPGERASLQFAAPRPQWKATRVNPQTDLLPKTTGVKVDYEEPPNPS